MRSFNSGWGRVAATSTSTPSCSSKSSKREYRGSYIGPPINRTRSLLAILIPGSLPHLLGQSTGAARHEQRRGAAVDAGWSRGYIAGRISARVRDGDEAGDCEGRGVARRARGIARSGLLVERRR